ncbi:uncharacterized protein LOC131214181, partial [Anopheles bellator]|uniref:uncharacterized protein LOC131214181 n=1 Tax=Anopheles bellator TaxID=139047 RepID=UPI002649027D
INSSMNSLIDQNDKQIRINSALETRLKNATKAINSILDFHNKTTEGFESINLIFHLDELTQQVEIIEEAITLARRNIPSSRIISPDEITLAQEFLKNSGLATNLIDDILDISTAYVLFGKDEIIYTLKVPRIKNAEYTFSYIEPVISNSHRIHLTSTYYLKGPGSLLSRTPLALVLRTILPTCIWISGGGRKEVVDIEKPIEIAISETGHAVKPRRNSNRKQERGDPIKLPKFTPQDVE